MKKMFFGALLFLGGISGMLMFFALSVIKPWSYNNTTGLFGFVLGTETSLSYALVLIMCIVGISICYYEAYVRK